jgi:S-formylglutathione hydrolase FrmB
LVGVGVLADLAVGGAEGLAGLFSGPGTNVSGSFWSRFRRRRVGFTIGYPEGSSPGSKLPVAIYLHGFRGDHRSAVSGYSPAGAATLANDVRRIAIATVDGGQGYWHPHPGDDPMSMVIEEFIPLLHRHGVGGSPGRVALLGTSMGGYGAIAMAEHHRGQFAAVGAISPAIFDTYNWAHYVNPGAYWSAADFAQFDAITHAGALSGLPVRVASGTDDPFHPWVADFARVLPAPGYVTFPPGAHTGSFFAGQTGPSVRFVAGHLS